MYVLGDVSFVNNDGVILGVMIFSMFSVVFFSAIVCTWCECFVALLSSCEGSSFM